MALNTNIALGVQTPQFESPMKMAMIASQLQQADQANQLNQMRMAEYTRENQNRNALSAAYAQSFDPTSGKLDYNKLTGLLASGGQGTQIPAILKQRTEEERAATEESARRAKLMQDTEAMYRNLSTEVKTKPDAIGMLQRMLNDPAMKGAPITQVPIMQLAQNIPEDKDGLDNWIKRFSLGATKYITENKPVTFAQDTGSGGRVMSRPGLGGAATVVPGSEFTKAKTFSDITAEGNLGVAQRNAALAEAKFAFEKANPTLSIQEDPNGLVAVNTRTGMAIPVVYGPNGIQAAPAAPAAAPGASIMRQPAATPATQAIPGMTSVLDRPAAAPAAAMPSAASTAGAQVRGKGQGLTEGERKASTLLQRLQFSQGQLTQALVDDPDAAKPGLFTSALDILSTPAANVLTSEARQRVRSAQLDILDAALTLGTGAAYTKDQLEGYRQSYFPQIGDGPKQVKDKKARLENVISAAKIAAGRGAALVPDTLSGANPNDPMDLGIRGR